jgi:hypothetical protein
MTGIERSAKEGVPVAMEAAYQRGAAMVNMPLPGILD